MIRLLFPYVCIEDNLLETGQLDQEYIDLLKNEIDSMRKKDPVGRKISNQYTGWQSNDGCESSPIFTKLIRMINHKFNTELLNWTGHKSNQIQLNISNSWANINDKGAWNAPHLHNGCWYSGVFYVKSDGDEGNFVAVDSDPKVVSDFPHSPRDRQNWNLAPKTGHLFLFPSALMHMVEPNPTDKDRYSISFNMNTSYLTKGLESRQGHPRDFHPDELCFEIDNNGKLTHKLST